MSAESRESHRPTLAQESARKTPLKLQNHQESRTPRKRVCDPLGFMILRKLCTERRDSPVA